MKRAWAVACGLLFMLFLATCGGGGGGSGSLYTGLTTPAAIDNTNAEEIALGAYEGGDMSGSLTAGVLSVRDERTMAPPAVKVAVLVRTIRNVTNSLDIEKQAAALMSQVRSLAVYPYTDRLFGMVAGYIDVSVSWNDQTGGFSGTFSFHDFDDGDDVVLNGSVGVSGTTSIYYIPQPQPGDILEIDFRFSSFTATDGIDTFRISGTIGLDTGIPTPPSMAVLNLMVRDEGTRKAVWIKDYTVTVAEGSDIGGTYTEATISGRIYFHDFGYVDVESIAPFRVYGSDPHPSAGSLVVTGKDGCKVRLTALDNTRYRVELDANPVDGTYEWLIEGFWI